MDENEFCDICGQASLSCEEIGGINLCRECANSHFECEECGELTHTSEEGVANLCMSCTGELYTKCPCCNEWTHNDDLEDNGICEGCYNQGYEYCDKCEEWHIGCNYIIDVEETWCDDCTSWHASLCCECGDYFRDEIYHDDNIYVCHNCYNNRDYNTCQDCGTISQYLEYHEGNECFYCESCMPEISIIHEYSYKPSVEFHSMECTTTPRLYLGIELEIENETKNKEGYEETALELLTIGNSKSEDEFYCKWDGSVRNGFEIVSHPMTLEYHQKYNWDEIFKKAVGNGYISHKSNNCGLHVHVNRDFFGLCKKSQDYEIMKILFLMETHWEQLKKFSRRNSGQLEQWAKNYGLKGKEFDSLLEETSNCGRYYALNLCPKNTIEFRLFRGTLKYNSFIATLQFVDGLCNLVIRKNPQDILEMSWDDIVNSPEMDKTELRTYLKERGLI